ncbi:MAG: histidine--tRNA ligase, partial [Actinobacteria bacterium]|nr:histidine--tRNA ligase [Actinomycetota bacterium]
DAMGVEYEQAPKLVRGLDYYVRTTFELVHDGLAVIAVATKLRTAQIVSEVAFDGRSMKAAMKGADRSGARFALIIGEDELVANVATVKDLDSGTQDSVALDLITDYLSSRIQTKD